MSHVFWCGQLRIREACEVDVIVPFAVTHVSRVASERHPERDIRRGNSTQRSTSSTKLKLSFARSNEVKILSKGFTAYYFLVLRHCRQIFTCSLQVSHDVVSRFDQYCYDA